MLVAVFVPISFLQGNVGKLFREFGFTIAAAVAPGEIISATATVVQVQAPDSLVGVATVFVTTCGEKDVIRMPAP